MGLIVTSRWVPVTERLPSTRRRVLATDGMLVKRPLLITDDAVLPGFKEADWAKALKK